MFKSQFILSCRSRYAHEYLNQASVGSRLSVEIELLPWNEKITNRYIKTFCRIRNRKELATELMSAFTSGEEMGEIARNPLLLTLYLCIVEESSMNVPLDVINKRTLFSKTLKMWSQRELDRFPSSKIVIPKEEELLLEAWRIAAWFIYQSRLTIDPPIKLDVLLSKVKSIVPAKNMIYKKESFAGLFDIQDHTNEVRGLIHEQLLEELVAELLFAGMKNGNYPFPDSLEVTIRWEINQLIQSMWDEADNDVLTNTLNNLVTIFHKSLNDNSPSGLFRRNQAAYYIGRIGTQAAISELIKADKKENNLFVKLSIAFGLVRLQKFDIEDSFMKKLREDQEWDESNRGYHLHYYRDWNIGNLQPPYKDPETVQWDRTLRALLFHIESSNMKHISIRRIELFTIRRFIETRKSKDSLTQEIMDQIDRSIDKITSISYPSLPVEYINGIHTERDKLKEAWKTAR